MEEWRQIKEYPDYYISNLARVRNKNGRLLRLHGKPPMVDLRINKIMHRCSVAKIFYITFMGGGFDKSEHFIYLDGDSRNITIENIISTKQRKLNIIEMYRHQEKLAVIADKYKIGIKLIKNILCEVGITVKKEKEFNLPKHHAKGKMETSVIPAEFHIPYADNCTVRPKVFDANAYLLRQFNYNY